MDSHRLAAVLGLPLLLWAPAALAAPAEVAEFWEGSPGTGLDSPCAPTNNSRPSRPSMTEPPNRSSLSTRAGLTNARCEAHASADYPRTRAGSRRSCPPTSCPISPRRWSA